MLGATQVIFLLSRKIRFLPLSAKKVNNVNWNDYRNVSRYLEILKWSSNYDSYAFKDADRIAN